MSIAGLILTTFLSTHFNGTLIPINITALGFEWEQKICLASRSWLSLTKTTDCIIFLFDSQNYRLNMLIFARLHPLDGGNIGQIRTKWIGHLHLSSQSDKVMDFEAQLYLDSGILNECWIFCGVLLTYIILLPLEKHNFLIQSNPLST